MKEIWTKCWGEFTEWFVAQWKYAWDLLKTSLIQFVQAIFQWIYAIAGALVLGLWKLVIKPVGKYIADAIIAWFEKL